MGAAMASDKDKVSISLYALAKEELDRYSGDRDAARKNLSMRLRNDPDLMSLVVDQIMDIAVSRSIRVAVSDQRRAIIRSNFSAKPDAGPVALDAYRPAQAPAPSNFSQAKIAMAAARNAVDRLMDFPLMNGTRLGDANKDLVKDQAMKFLRPVREHVASHTFLKLIADEMKDGKTVRQQFDENDLREFRAKAEKKADTVVAEGM